LPVVVPVVKPVLAEPPLDLMAKVPPWGLTLALVAVGLAQVVEVHRTHSRDLLAEAAGDQAHRRSLLREEQDYRAREIVAEAVMQHLQTSQQVVAVAQLRLAVTLQPPLLAVAEPDQATASTELAACTALAVVAVLVEEQQERAAPTRVTARTATPLAEMA
jgi:hypothetical protein